MNNSGFGYNVPAKIKNFHSLRRVVVWAALLGILQGLLWMGLTITGILSYNCIIPLNAKLTYGSLIQTVFMDLYFKGDCTPDGYQNYDKSVLNTVTTIFDPSAILIWNCVYLAVAACWIISSMMLLIYVQKNNAKSTVNALYAWGFFTLGICLMDVALGVTFGLDYSSFHDAGYNYNLNSINAGAINPFAAMLVAASVTSVSLMIISLKGFVLWIINASLMVYLLTRAMIIANDKDGNDTLFMPRKDSDDILTTRPPINAYEEQKSSTSTAYVNEAYVAETHSMDTIELNQDAIARAARMSTDAPLQERRFRNLDAFQQYPPLRPNNNSHLSRSQNRPETSGHQEQIVSSGISQFPAPDYSPPMARSHRDQSHNGMIRNPGYQ